MGWGLVLGFLAGLALGVKYHRNIMSLIGTAEARVATWKQALTEDDRKKGESTDAQGLYDVTEEIRSMGVKDEVQGEGDRESIQREVRERSAASVCQPGPNVLREEIK
jgi:hypothetical protein